MPSYPLSPIGRNVQQAVPGLPFYALGSLNRLTCDTRMLIKTVALAGTTATIVVQVIEGLVPVAGQLISITGAVPAYFNVTNVSIASVSAALSPDTGVYTITFTLANTTIATTASPGLAVAPQVEVGDALVAGASAQCAIQENVNPANGKSLRADVHFPTLPGACTVKLQTAVLDLDTEYQDLATVATVTGGVLALPSSVIVTGVEALFARLNVSGIAAGGSAKIIGKITI